MSEDKQEDPVLKALRCERDALIARHRAALEAVAMLDGAIETHKALKDGTAAIVPGPKVAAYERPEYEARRQNVNRDEGAVEPSPTVGYAHAGTTDPTGYEGPTRCVALDYDRTRVSPHPKTVYLKPAEALAHDFVKGRWYVVAVHPAAARSYI